MSDDDNLSSPEQPRRNRSNSHHQSINQYQSISQLLPNNLRLERLTVSNQSISQSVNQSNKPSISRPGRRDSLSIDLSVNQSIDLSINQSPSGNDNSPSFSVDLSNHHSPLRSINQSIRPRHDRTVSLNIDRNHQSKRQSINQSINQSIKHQSIKPSASRYDFIKVRVYNGPHYSVLSRYLLARRLSLSGLSSSLCIKVALAVKKRLVDFRMLDISINQLEKVIRKCMRDCSMNDSEIDRWIRISAFIECRTPIIILITGVPSSGKSNAARKLANKLNVSTVIATQSINQLAYTNDLSIIETHTPLHLMHHQSIDHFLDLHRARCQAVRESLTYEIEKCVKQGRSMIIEGTEIDSSLYADLGQSLNQSINPSANGNQSINQSTNQSANQSINQSTNQSTQRPIVLSFFLQIEPIDHTLMLCQSINQYQHAVKMPINFDQVKQNIAALNQFFTDCTNQSINQSISQSIVQVPSRSSVSVARQMHNIVLKAMSERYNGSHVID